MYGLGLRGCDAGRGVYVRYKLIGHKLLRWHGSEVAIYKSKSYLITPLRHYEIIGEKHELRNLALLNLVRNVKG